MLQYHLSLLYDILVDIPYQNQIEPADSRYKSADHDVSDFDMSEVICFVDSSVKMPHLLAGKIYLHE